MISSCSYHGIGNEHLRSNRIGGSGGIITARADAAFRYQYFYGLASFGFVGLEPENMAKIVCIDDQA
jgi:hypothetical protein